MGAIKLLDVVALTEDLAARDVAGDFDPDVEPRDLPRGLVGTVVDELDGTAHLVEFANNDGETYAMVALRDDQLLLLQFELADASVA
jgi:hypothetical protein